MITLPWWMLAPFWGIRWRYPRSVTAHWRLWLVWLRTKPIHGGVLDANAR